MIWRGPLQTKLQASLVAKYHVGKTMNIMKTKNIYFNLENNNLGMYTQMYLNCREKKCYFN